MRKLFNIIICLGLSTVTLIAQTSSGGSYKITSTVIGGGGGISSGSGNKSIEGTVGQSAAGPRTGGNKSHDAGFWPTALAQPTPNQGGQTTVQFSAATYQIQEQLGALTITVTRTGDTSGTTTVRYATVDSGATQKGDFEYGTGRLLFAPGETMKTFQVLINEDMFSEFNESFNVQLNNPVGAAIGGLQNALVTIVDDPTEQPANPIDDPQAFVHMQYHDFLNREPDAAGLAFWTNEITSCGNDQNCIDVKRVNVSAAFFLSIEFQQTGFLVHRTYRAANGLSSTPPTRFVSFLDHTQTIGRGLVVNQLGWEQVLETNKVAFFANFVAEGDFDQEFPTSHSPAEFVDALFLNTGIIPTTAERQAAIDEFGGSAVTTDASARARSLRKIVESTTFTVAEQNKAFVMMQYYGYLRRNPNDPPEPLLNFDGYNFWLNKLNQFNGNYVNSDMVKAFLVSGEYRQRFGMN